MACAKAARVALSRAVNTTRIGTVSKFILPIEIELDGHCFSQMLLMRP